MGIINGSGNIHSSFSFRLSLKFSMIVTEVLVLAVFLLIYSVNFAVRTAQKEELKHSNDDIARVLSNWTDTTRDPYFNLPYYLSYSVIDKSLNHVVYTNDPFLPTGLEKSLRPQVYFEKNYFSDGNLRILYFMRDYSFENLLPYSDRTSSIFTVVTAINLDSLFFSKLGSMVPVIILPGIAFIIFVSFILSYIITSNTIKPVVGITKEVQKNSVMILDTMLPVSGKNDEIDELARAFNFLFARLKNDFEREKQFSSDVSHELKTPLTVINGQADLLMRWGKDDPAQLEASLKSIKEEAKSMQYIIETLLQMSRYESGRVKPEIAVFYVRELYERLKAEFEQLGNVRIHIVVGENIILTSDPELLHQIFTAFISNSIKFCEAEECEIWLEARYIELVDSETNEKKIVLSERDNGPGFSEADLPNVFNRFYMGDQARNRRTKKNSTGLGLAIAKILCEALGGIIYASNAPEGGALLAIEL